ncbi:MAG: hypothetical protein NTX53_02030 [candidate division WOR-3 bacterium]|nr:hypothetical protein [candidate division WOR-3 bacterium]
MGTSMFLSDVKARHDKMVESVERMMAADGWILGREENRVCDKQSVSQGKGEQP